MASAFRNTMVALRTVSPAAWDASASSAFAMPCLTVVSHSGTKPALISAGRVGLRALALGTRGRQQQTRWDVRAPGGSPGSGPAQLVLEVSALFSSGANAPDAAGTPRAKRSSKRPRREFPPERRDQARGVPLGPATRRQELPIWRAGREGAPGGVTTPELLTWSV